MNAEATVYVGHERLRGSVVSKLINLAANKLSLACSVVENTPVFLAEGLQSAVKHGRLLLTLHLSVTDTPSPF